jgi:drug/metabolite transporter (DMT)-like permease
MLEWTGVMLAFGGFIYLVLPTVTEPSFFSFVLMTVAGIAWGIYTVIGRTSKNPLSDTAINFIRTLPFIVVLYFFSMQDTHLSSKGILLALLSGGIASGMGYTVWYIALGSLSSLQAGVLQLLVPVIAAFGGVVFSSESISTRLIVAALFVLGGIATVLFGKKYFYHQRTH